jgi:Flp pilus assembly protein TadD
MKNISTATFLILFALLTIPSTPSTAQLLTIVDRCNGAPIPSARIEACTQVITSGDFTQKQVAASHNNRGYAYSNLGDYDRAMDDYNRAVSLDPTVGFAYNNRGAIYRTLGQIDRAMVEFNKAIQLDPKFAAAFRNRCWTKAKHLNKLKGAVPDCEKALSLRPEDAKASYGLGYIYEQMGDTNMAIQEYNRTLRLDPYHSQAKQDLARLSNSS